MTDRDNFGDQALHVAAQYNKESAVSFCLDNGADINARGGHSQTALIRAAMYGGLETVNLLLSRGADVTIKDWERKTAMELVCVKGGHVNGPAIMRALQVGS